MAHRPPGGGGAGGAEPLRVRLPGGRPEVDPQTHGGDARPGEDAGCQHEGSRVPHQVDGAQPDREDGATGEDSEPGEAGVGLHQIGRVGSAVGRIELRLIP